MKKKNEGKAIIVASAIALIIILAGTSALFRNRAGYRLSNTSAVVLAHTSFANEKVSLRQQAQHLGSVNSSEAIEEQWKVIRSRMQLLGASPEIAEGVITAVKTSKYRISGQLWPGSPLWPLSINSGYVNDNKVWIVHLALWMSNPPTSQSFCGTGLDDPFRLLAYSTYVVNNDMPHLNWVSPEIHRLLSPDEQKQCARDDGYFDVVNKDELRN